MANIRKKFLHIRDENGIYLHPRCKIIQLDHDDSQSTSIGYIMSLMDDETIAEDVLENMMNAYCLRCKKKAIEKIAQKIINEPLDFF